MPVWWMLGADSLGDTMRIAALCDIHGNLRALEAVLAEVKSFAPDRILVGGDVALGPMPREVLALLDTLGDRVIYLRGNCDREMVESLASSFAPASPWGARTRWAAEHCTLAQMNLLADLPTTIAFDIVGLGETLFCHGSPRRDDEILTRVSPPARLRAAKQGRELTRVVHAHTHVQYQRTVEGTHWICPGSVGIPYENEPGAYWATFGPVVTLRRTPYDLERAIADVRAARFPDAEEFIDKYLLNPYSPDHASTYFESLAAPAKTT
jgi:putative phosphoesterase